MTVAPADALQRFVVAQAPVYERVCAELAAGRKTSHWMWFIFPQLKQLGSSSNSQYFGIASRQEAADYWHHPLLGTRLWECSELVLAVEGKTALDIFGFIDALKFQSSMTLFDQAAPAEPVFRQALDKYYKGERDGKTLALLQ